ncbi:hypothetical protein [Nonomuraea sp. JJY05]|uniref:hypothetical protein n=1 Tax=Nonomuraea sp. JJY05 TaxID=3350255 RepID=UPI00373E55D5
MPRANISSASSRGTSQPVTTDRHKQLPRHLGTEQLVTTDRHKQLPRHLGTEQLVTTGHHEHPGRGGPAVGEHRGCARHCRHRHHRLDPRLDPRLDRRLTVRPLAPVGELDLQIQEISRRLSHSRPSGTGNDPNTW